MKRDKWVWLLWCGLALGLAGCGSDDYQAGNRLTVALLADAEGSTAPILYAVEETDDSGVNGTLGDGDDGEGDGFPDNGEVLITALASDIGVVDLANESRPGVKEGVDLQVYLIDVTYYDANGNTPLFAPRYRQSVTATVASDSTASLDFTLVPLEMKLATGGLRDIFLYGTAAEKTSVSRMTAVVDVYARDPLNDDNVLASGAMTLQFVNPMVSN